MRRQVSNRWEKKIKSKVSKKIYVFTEKDLGIKEQKLHTILRN